MHALRIFVLLGALVTLMIYLGDGYGFALDVLSAVVADLVLQVIRQILDSRKEPPSLPPQRSPEA